MIYVKSRVAVALILGFFCVYFFYLTTEIPSFSVKDVRKSRILNKEEVLYVDFEVILMHQYRRYS